MKNLIYIGIVSLGLLSASCESFLDRQPKSDISVDSYWKTSQDLETWNAGMYDGLQATLKTGWFDWGELRGGTYAPRGTGWDTNLLYNGLTSTSGSSSWKNLYATIYRANAAIKYIPTCPVLQSVSDPYLAQAYAMRALMYFYAIRVWGAVPKITEPMEDVYTQERYCGRTSIEEIKELMLTDIETAMELFGDASTNIASLSKYYLNRGSVMALKLDILMWYKDFDEALVVANDLLKNYGYQLEPAATYNGMFRKPDSSKEMILNLYWNYVEDNGGFGYAQRIASGSNTIQYHPTKEVFNDLIGRKYENDSRIVLVLDTLKIHNTVKDYAVESITDETYENFYAGQYGNAANFQIKCPKFTEYGATADDGKPGYVYSTNAEDNTRMPIYRIADIMLLKAEALAQCSTPDLQEAVNIVNSIRQRAGWTRLADISEYNTVDKVINLIIDERTIEFWAEGKHWFDLVRNNKVKEYLDPYMRNLDEDYMEEEGFVIGLKDIPANPIGGYGRILWPLNQDVFKKNPNMAGQQNQPYTE